MSNANEIQSEISIKVEIIVQYVNKRNVLHSKSYNDEKANLPQYANTIYMLTQHNKLTLIHDFCNYMYNNINTQTVDRKIIMIDLHPRFTVCQQYHQILSTWHLSSTRVQVHVKGTISSTIVLRGNHLNYEHMYKYCIYPHWCVSRTYIYLCIERNKLCEPIHLERYLITLITLHINKLRKVWRYKKD